MNYISRVAMGLVLLLSACSNSRHQREFTGRFPISLTAGSEGCFYGTTTLGGAKDCGTVFRLSREGRLETVIEFTGRRGKAKGAAPWGVTLLNDGGFAGTTSGGGRFNCGTIFRVSPGGNFKTLVEFTGTAGLCKGDHPMPLLCFDEDGCIYGTTRLGGAGGKGTVFKMDGTGKLTTLVEFSGESGPELPFDGLTQGARGEMYGVSLGGGAHGRGTLFTVTRDGRLSVLVHFSGRSGPCPGECPDGHLTPDGKAGFYGVTNKGGTADKGTVFHLSSGGKFTSLYSFSDPGSEKSSGPVGPLVLMPNGTLYGSTRRGGKSAYGTIFRLSPGGRHTCLVEFAGGRPPAGSEPVHGLVATPDLDLYGVTAGDGSSQKGTAFTLCRSGLFKTLAEFSGSRQADGP